MKLLLSFGVAAALVCPTMALAAATCPDMAAPSIVAPASEAAASCLSAIAKGATGFVKAKMSTEGKCLSKLDADACPNTKDDDKIRKAALKAVDKIASACGDNAVQAGLASAYGGSTDESKISSCVLGQHNATTAVMVGLSNGAPGAYSGNTDRAKCAGAISKSASKMVAAVLKAVNSCVDGELKAGNAADLGPVCVGSWSGGALTPASNSKTADKIAKALAKAQDGIDKSCAGLASGTLGTIFACEGATSVADYQSCIVCRNWDGMLDLLDQQYNEDADTFVDNAPGALQTAVNAASAGDKLLIASGTYQEVVNIPTDDLSLVGCGAATDDRPQIEPPTTGGPFPNGILAANRNNLLFQGLKVYNWDENGIFATGCDGVTFRDIEGDGNLNSTYAVFPVESNNVTVEACHVQNVADAGIYVGSSTNILVRYNRVEGNVAGLEIENSGNADVYNNLARDNTGGILVFKLPSPPVQISLDHDVHHNVSVHNNTPNYGAPGSTVGLIPDGTGMFIISTDTSDFHHNYVADNHSLGMVLIDQLGINALVGSPVFDPTSVDQTSFDNEFYRNNLGPGCPNAGANGCDPDDDGDNATPIGGGYVFFLGDEQGGAHSNCWRTSGADLNSGPVTFLTANDCS